MPQLTLSLPVAIGLMLLLLVIGAGVIFALLQNKGAAVADVTPTPTASQTPTITMTPTASFTATIANTATLLPPTEYTVLSGDTCLSIAARFGVSSASIIALNVLPQDCTTLSEGQKLLIPQATPTPTLAPTGTLSSSQATELACQFYPYTVVSGDTLSSIAANYNVSTTSIQSYNGLSSDVVYEGMDLNIPLCERLPTAGPTPTATNPPPYSAPNLLLPADGAVFSADNDSVTLQWNSVATLNQNEAYAVTIEDTTAGDGTRLTEYVTDTKFIVPVSFRPVDSKPHVLRWYVLTVRQTGTSADGKPIYDTAGATSTSRAFVWWSTTSVTLPTETPGAESTATP